MRQMTQYLPDVSCSSIEMAVANAPGTQLGTDVYLKEVKLIVEHTYTGDLDIRLRSPNGVFVNLSANNGGSGDNYGDPLALTCTSVTNFSMGASTPISLGLAPFIGSFIPQGDFATFNDGSNPVGFWTLEVCDDASQDIGTLLFVELGFGNALGCTGLTSPANAAVNVPANATLTWRRAAPPATAFTLAPRPAARTS